MTYEQIKQDAIEELDSFLEDSPSESKVRDFIDNAATEAVPVMTTELFGLVVNDNSLAFEEAEDTEGAEPFAVLACAVRARLYRDLTAHYEEARS